MTTRERSAARNSTSTRLLIDDPRGLLHAPKALSCAPPDREHASTGNSTWKAYELRTAPSYLVASERSGTAALRLAHRRPRAGTPHLVLEPITTAGRARLLAACVAHFELRVDGLLVPRLSVLADGDSLQVAPDVSVWVTSFREACVTRPEGELLKYRCGVCRGSLHAKTRVVVCACGQAMHLESAADAESGAEPLECALLGGCPDCGAQLPTESGYAWLPDGCLAERAETSVGGLA